MQFSCSLPHLPTLGNIGAVCAAVFLTEVGLSDVNFTLHKLIIPAYISPCGEVSQFAANYALKLENSSNCRYEEQCVTF
jgi:hypothetical protein